MTMVILAKEHTDTRGDMVRRWQRVTETVALGGRWWTARRPARVCMQLLVSHHLQQQQKKKITLHHPPTIHYSLFQYFTMSLSSEWLPWIHYLWCHVAWRYASTVSHRAASLRERRPCDMVMKGCQVRHGTVCVCVCVCGSWKVGSS